MTKNANALIEERRSLDTSSGCIIWTGATRGTSHYPVLNKAAGRGDIHVRRYIWERETDTAIPNKHTLWMRCQNTLCTNHNHMVLLAPGDVLSGKQITTYSEDLYKHLPCDHCDRPCRVRGKKRKGEPMARIVDGLRLCGPCSQRYAHRPELDKGFSAAYDGSLDDLLEDVEFLLSSGEIMENVAIRLGLNSKDHLYHILRDNDRRDLINRFNSMGVINEPLLYSNIGSQSHTRSGSDEF